MFFLAIFDAVRISEALVQRKLHDRVRVLENWLLWPKWKLWCYSWHCQCAGAPDIGNNHIWGFWGAYDVAWASFFPWILFNLWFPVISILSTLYIWVANWQWQFSCAYNLSTRICGQQTPLTPPGRGHGAERRSSISKKNLDKACMQDGWG